MTQSLDAGIEVAKRRERGGRRWRGASCARTGRQGHGRPYIVRNIPTYDILSEENLLRIEETADRILAEIGIEFRDDPVALDHWRRAGAKVDGVLVKFEPGMLREILKTAPAELHPACAQSGQFGRDRRQERRVLAGLWLALRHGSRQGPPLRHDRGFPQFREAGAVLAMAAPFRRHDLRAGRRAGQQAPSRHGLQPHQLFRPRLHGLGDGREPGGRLHRHGAHRLRRGLRRSQLRHPRQRQRQLAAGLGRDDDDCAARLCARQPGGGDRAVHPRRRHGAGDQCRRDRPVARRNHGRLRADPVGAARRAGDLRQFPVVHVAAFRLADLRHAGAGDRLDGGRPTGAAARTCRSDAPAISPPRNCRTRRR